MKNVALFAAVAFSLLSGCYKPPILTSSIDRAAQRLVDEADRSREAELKSKRDPVRAPVHPAAAMAAIVLDRNLEPNERRKISWSYQFAQDRWVPVTREEGILDEGTINLFGRDAQGLTRYLQNRIQYLYSPDTDLLNLGGMSGITTARNIGSIVLILGVLEALQEGRDPTKPKAKMLGESPVVATSSRVGVVQLAPLFSKLSDFGGLVALIHEARHSDCPGGLRTSKVRGFIKQKLSALETQGQCGLPHIVCPRGHDLEGLFGCEMGTHWGPYATEMLAIRQIARTCKDCSREELEELAVRKSDMVTRVQDIDELISGKLGYPNLDHQGIIVD